MSMPDPDGALPNEVLADIFLQLPPSAVANVTCVSQRFQAVAERILYSSIHIQDILSTSSPAPWRTHRWCNSMIKRLNQVSMVRKVHIRWHADASPPPSQYFITFCEQLGEMLRLLTFLESLELFLGPANLLNAHYHEPIHAIERIIRQCRFPQLQSCSLGADYTKGAQAYTRVLADFLAAHTSLRHLKVPDLHAPVTVPTASLPHLASFRGSPDAAASLLPGRPVEYLCLFGQDSDVNRENLPRMTLTSIPLRVLDLSNMSVRPVLLRNVATYLPTIQTLSVKLALRHTLHYAFTGIRILSGLSAVLQAFTQLEFLDLSPTGVGGVGRADSQEELALCREWHRACPSLRRLIFPSGTAFVLSEGDIWSLVSR